jgi:hypothetical protein
MHSPIHNARRRIRRAVGVLAVLAAGVSLAEPIREAELTCEPPVGDKQIFTIRLRPGMNQECDALVFDCYYRQVFLWEMTNEPTALRVHEPEFFTYKRKNVKLVEDLDRYISFWVPAGMETLRTIYGDTAFKTNCPVSVGHIVISAIVTNTTLWTLDLGTNGVQKFDAPASNAPASRPVGSSP